MDDAAAELGIWPWKADEFQPVELSALQRGQQRLWNRQCVLTAWSTYILACVWGGFKDTDFATFMKRYPPPGYDPKA